MSENPLYEQFTEHANPLLCYNCDLWIAANVPFWIRLPAGVCLCDDCHTIELNQ